MKDYVKELEDKLPNGWRDFCVNVNRVDLKTSVLLMAFTYTDELGAQADAVLDILRNILIQDGATLQQRLTRVSKQAVAEVDRNVGRQYSVSALGEFVRR